MIYKDYLITIFCFKDSNKELKFRGYAYNLTWDFYINPLIDKKYLVADCYNDILELVKTEIDKQEK